MSRAVHPVSIAVLACCLLSAPLFQGLCAELPVPMDPLQPKSAEADARNVIIKVGRHQGFVRFVFLSSEGNIYSGSAKQAGKDTIAVEFPPALTYHVAEKGQLRGDSVTEVAKDVKIAVKRSGCWITIENLSDFKVSKLTFPPRLVIDAAAGQQAMPAVPGKPQAPPHQPETAPKLVTFMIDAGHGGYDKGIRGESFTEKDFALSLSKDLGSGLMRKGRKVFVTRKADQVLTISERLRLAGQRSPDLLLSLHVSSDGRLRIYGSPRRPSGGQDDRQGADPYAKAHAAAQSFAESLAQTIRGETDLDVEVDSLPLALIARVKSPSLVIEMPNPEKFNYEGKGREKLLAALVKGLTALQP